MLDHWTTSASNAAVDEIVCHTIFLNPIEGSERKYNDMTKTFSSSGGGTGLGSWKAWEMFKTGAQ